MAVKNNDEIEQRIDSSCGAHYEHGTAWPMTGIKHHVVKDFRLRVVLKMGANETIGANSPTLILE